MWPPGSTRILNQQLVVSRLSRVARLSEYVASWDRFNATCSIYFHFHTSPFLFPRVGYRDETSLVAAT